MNAEHAGNIRRCKQKAWRLDSLKGVGWARGIERWRTEGKGGRKDHGAPRGDEVGRQSAKAKGSAAAHGRALVHVKLRDETARRRGEVDKGETRRVGRGFARPPQRPWPAHATRSPSWMPGLPCL